LADYLLRDFDSDERTFIVNELYPQLREKLKEAIILKREHQGLVSLKCDIKVESNVPPPDSTDRDANV